MNFSKYLKTWTGKVQEINYHRKITLGLLLLLFLICILLFRKETLVVIQPFTLTNEASISINDSSQSYKESWGLALSLLLGNITPSNSDYIKERIGPLLHQSIYTDTMVVLQMQVDQIKDDRISTRFEPRSVVYEKTSDKVFVSGYYYIQSGIGKPEKTERTYEFVVEISNYLPLINFIDTYQGQPKTENVLKKEKNRQNQRENKK